LPYDIAEAHHQLKNHGKQDRRFTRIGKSFWGQKLYVFGRNWRRWKLQSERLAGQLEAYLSVVPTQIFNVHEQLHRAMFSERYRDCASHSTVVNPDSEFKTMLTFATTHTLGLFLLRTAYPNMCQGKTSLSCSMFFRFKQVVHED